MPNIFKYDNNFYWHPTPDVAIRAKDELDQMEILYFGKNGEIQCVTRPKPARSNLYNEVKSIMEGIV